jgi:hypothetical protein
MRRGLQKSGRLVEYIRRKRLRLKCEFPTLRLLHLYEIPPRKDHYGVDLISAALPFGRLCYGGRNAASNAIGYAKSYSRSHDAVIRVYDDAGKVIKTHEHAGDFKEW